MTDNSGKFLKGLILGGSLLGVGYYLSKNKQFTEQLSTKVTDGLNVLSESSHGVQDKLTSAVSDTKSTLGKTLSETKSSLSHSFTETKSSLTESISKTNKQLTDTISRLGSAFQAGRNAASESLKNSQAETVKFPDKSSLTPIKNSQEKPLGAVEDTSVDNTSAALHPPSNNVAQSVGDAGTNFDKSISGINPAGGGGDNRSAGI